MSIEKFLIFRKKRLQNFVKAGIIIENYQSRTEQNSSVSYAKVAQLVARRIRNAQVEGSSPFFG